MKDPKEIVREGYDNLACRYREYFNSSHQNAYSTWIKDLIALIPEDAAVLELGCGDGVPVAGLLSQRFRYTGIDLSAVQLDAAKQNVPCADFLLADMSCIDYPENKFAGIVALYAIIHIPISEQKLLLTSIHHWLQPGGYFLCTLGTSAWTGTETNWIKEGTTMYWSHADAKTYRHWFIEIGFTVIEEEFIEEGENGHTFFLCRKASRINPYNALAVTGQ